MVFVKGMRKERRVDSSCSGYSKTLIIQAFDLSGSLNNRNVLFAIFELLVNSCCIHWVICDRIQLFRKNIILI